MMLCDICQNSLVPAGNPYIVYCPNIIEFFPSLNCYIDYSHTYISFDKEMKSLLYKEISFPPYHFKLNYTLNTLNVFKSQLINKSLKNQPISHNSNNFKHKHILKLPEIPNLPFNNLQKTLQKLSAYSIML